MYIVPVFSDQDLVFKRIGGENGRNSRQWEEN
jgi:hypothetical protein